MRFFTIGINKIEEIAKKYGNVQKGAGSIMRGPLIETETRRLWDKTRKKAAREDAVRFLKMGKLTAEEITEGTELSVEEVKQLEAQLAEVQTV